LLHQLIERANGFRAQANHLGWRRTAQLRLLRRLGVHEIRLGAPGLRERVTVRVGDSDIYDFEHSLGKWREPLLLPFMPRTIVDAGANVGYTILRFAQEFPSARIVAIEPDAGNLRQLEKNCGELRQLEVEPKALWPRHARLTISNPEAGSNAFMVAEDAAGDIEAVSIPDIMERYSLATIDLLKIDIEGSEIELFADPGCHEWLPKVRAILVETHDRMRPESSETVRAAVSRHMAYRGQTGEYEFYVNLQL
jgi:FkbM family methyltransferase